jgi:hypothetical protein
MSTEQYDQYCEAYLKCEKLRRDLRELHKQKNSLKYDSKPGENKDLKSQDIQKIADQEQEKEIELRKAETLLKTQENELRDSMNAAKDSSWAVDHAYGGSVFMISLTKGPDGKGYLNANKRS